MRLVCCENIKLNPLKLFNCNDLFVTPFKIYNMDSGTWEIFACEMWNPWL